ncbi:hypothetical protein ACFVL4_16705 [Bacillus subtilis]|uniref:Uncharacterized protein n=1 Tax=Bacillus cabrialesii subsp. tritici TaxID=2944916 RepID=A0ABT9DN99_9BACI|nr:hypothetical protein [Bacillus cabrialesii]MDO8226109.1 hypothetical protein [Bacillus cabrialesii subsp. tritici]
MVKLNSETLNHIGSALDTKIKTRECRVCEEGTTHIFDKFVYLKTEPEGNEDPRPTVMLVCDNCGGTQFFVAPTLVPELFK